MNRTKNIVLLLAFVFLSACSAQSGNPSDDYIGMTIVQAEAKATASDVPFRVVMLDGEALPVTLDYRIGRINATVVGGVVTSYEVEGSD